MRRDAPAIPSIFRKSCTMRLLPDASGNGSLMTPPIRWQQSGHAAGLPDIESTESPAMLRHPHPIKVISAGRRVLSRRRPDGFTLLLAALGLGALDPWAVAGPLNAGLFGLTVFIVGMYLRGRPASRLLTLWCCLALAWPLALQRGAALSAKARRIVIYTLIALGPVGIWMLRNQLVVGGTTGSREYAVDLSTVEILFANLKIIAGWPLPAPLVGSVELTAAYVLLGCWMALLAIAGGAAVWAHCRGIASAAQDAQLVFTGFAAAHIAAIVAARALGWSEIIPPHYLAPACLPQLLSTMLALDAALGYIGRWSRAWGTTARAVVIAGRFSGLAGLDSVQHPNHLPDQ